MIGCCKSLCLSLLLCLSRKLIRMRKEEVVSAVIIIQRYFKTRFLKKRYLKVKYLTVWLQSRCRKVIAKLRVNRIVLSRLMSEGKNTLVCICMYVCMYVYVNIVLERNKFPAHCREKPAAKAIQHRSREYQEDLV